MLKEQIDSCIPQEHYRTVAMEIMVRWLCRMEATVTMYKNLRCRIPREQADEMISWIRENSDSSHLVRHYWRALFYRSVGRVYHGQTEIPKGKSAPSCRYPTELELARGLRDGVCARCGREKFEVDEYGCTGRPRPVSHELTELMWDSLSEEDQKRVTFLAGFGFHKRVGDSCPPDAPYLPLRTKAEVNRITEKTRTKIVKLVNKRSGARGKQAGGLWYIVKHDGRFTADGFISQLQLVAVSAVYRYEWRREKNNETNVKNGVVGIPYQEAHIVNTAMMLVNNAIRAIQNEYNKDSLKRIAPSGDASREYDVQVVSLDEQVGEDGGLSRGELVGREDPGFSDVEDRDFCDHLYDHLDDKGQFAVGVILNQDVPQYFLDWLSKEFGVGYTEFVSRTEKEKLEYVTLFLTDDPGDSDPEMLGYVTNELLTGA